MIIHSDQVLAAAMYLAQAKASDPAWARLPQSTRDQWRQLGATARSFAGSGTIDRIDMKRLEGQIVATCGDLFAAESGGAVARAFVHMLPVVTDDVH